MYLPENFQILHRLGCWRTRNISTKRGKVPRRWRNYI